MPIRILIVDDQAPMRGALAAFLATHEDMEVIGQTGDGEAAVAMAQQLQPDIVVMDLLLPTIDGIEATVRVKAVCPDTDVVLLSARLDRDIEAEALAAGAVAFVGKLGALDQLERAIHCAYDTRRARAAPRG